MASCLYNVAVGAAFMATIPSGMGLVVSQSGVSVRPAWPARTSENGPARDWTTRRRWTQTTDTYMVSQSLTRCGLSLEQC